MQLSFKIHLGVLLSSVMSRNKYPTVTEDVSYYLKLFNKEYGSKSIEHLWLRSWNSIYTKSPAEAELLLRKYLRQIENGVTIN